MNVLITGNSSGLGLGLTEAHLDRGDRVIGFSRRGCPLRHDGLVDVHLDLARGERVADDVKAAIAAFGALDLAYLNAGILGPIQDLQVTPLEDLKAVMAINLWANKVLLDVLAAAEPPPAQVVAISSGAAVNGNRGWGGYALSKAALNMLIQLYAGEMPGTHLCALAPGLVDTAMQDVLCGEVDRDRYPSVNKLIEARGTAGMPEPRAAADHIVSLLPALRERLDSGAFADVRSF